MRPAIRRCRCAGSAWSTWTTSAPPSLSARARDWAGFRAALRDWSVAIFNFVYADANGHIGYQMAGRIPIRGRVVPGFRDANAAADQWQGNIPFDDLPHMYDPPSGYVASANQRIVPDDWKQPIYGAYSQGHRGVRLDQALGGSGAMDTAANIELQNDVKNCRAERLCPHILRHLAGDSRRSNASSATGTIAIHSPASRPRCSRHSWRYGSAR